MSPRGVAGEARAYWVTRPGRGELRAEAVPLHPARGHSLIAAEFSGVSPGTERLVGLGHVPAGCERQMACNYMAGDFSLPIKYGYDLVGTAVAGELAGMRVFVMHPHQELAHVEDRLTLELPDRLPARRAVLIPNLETALNAVWDAELEGGEKIVIVGGGALGLLVSYVVGRVHAMKATVVEPDDGRRALAAGLGWIEDAVPPERLSPLEFDVAFHASTSSAGLQLAIDALGLEGRVIDLTWYGDQPVSLELGTHFHYLRKRIIASQVGCIARSRREVMGIRERLQEVVGLLESDQLDPLLGSPVPFDEMPVFMRELYTGGATPFLPVIEYATSRGA